MEGIGAFNKSAASGKNRVWLHFGEEKMLPVPAFSATRNKLFIVR
jgi:hypothetical protein